MVITRIRDFPERFSKLVKDLPSWRDTVPDLQSKESTRHTSLTIIDVLSGIANDHLSAIQCLLRSPFIADQ